MTKKDKVRILGIDVDNVTMEEAIGRIEDMIRSGAKGYVVTPTVDHMVMVQKDPAFREAYLAARLIVPDGMPLIWASYFLGSPLKERICGSDILPRLCETAARRRWRVFFLGGLGDVAEKAAKMLRQKSPQLDVCGIYSPSMGFEKKEEENRRIVEMVNRAKPDVLFVGVGSPKQEVWMRRYQSRLDATVTIGIGNSFAFAAGIVKRAPRWMQNVGFEWLWRVLMEPRRLWKRYFLKDPVFFWYVLQQRFGRFKTQPATTSNHGEEESSVEKV